MERGGGGGVDCEMLGLKGKDVISFCRERERERGKEFLQWEWEKEMERWDEEEVSDYKEIRVKRKKKIWLRELEGGDGFPSNFK